MERKKRSNLGVVSLFTGAGGLDEGFRSAGFSIRCAVELERWASDTLRANHPDAPVMGPPDHSGNVKEISGDDVLGFAELTRNQVNVVVGGPPCQPFSQAATQRFLSGDARFKRQGFGDQVKGTLLFDFVRIVLDLEPDVFLLENVPGIASIDGGVQLDSALLELSAAGYSISPIIATQAADYGVPQYRRRMLIIGSKLSEAVRLPEPTHGNGLFVAPYNCVAHALVDFPLDAPNHLRRNHAKSSVARYRQLAFGEREPLGRVDRLDPLAPSKTVIAGGSNGGGRSHLHPFIARTLTVRECARLQTFRDDYLFEGSMARQFTQVGNAVPPLLAEVFARHIMTQEFKEAVPGKLVHGRFLADSDEPQALAERLSTQSYDEIEDELMRYAVHPSRIVHGA